MASLARLLEKPFINLFSYHEHRLGHHRHLDDHDDRDGSGLGSGIWGIIMWNQGGACIGSGTRADNPEAFLNWTNRWITFYLSGAASLSSSSPSVSWWPSLSLKNSSKTSIQKCCLCDKMSKVIALNWLFIIMSVQTVQHDDLRVENVHHRMYHYQLVSRSQYFQILPEGPGHYKWTCWYTRWKW